MEAEKNYPELNVLHQGLPYENYAAFDGLRSGDLHLLKRSPAHWRARQGTPLDPTPALEFGKLFHEAIQCPERFMDLMKIEPKFEGFTKDGKLSTRSAEAKRLRTEWFMTLPKDSIIVSQEDRDKILGMLNSCTSHSLVKNLLKNGVRETSLWVQDEETGEILKARPDFISALGHVVDIKTTMDASYPYFFNEIYKSKTNRDRYYALQAAHYTHCAKLSRALVNESRVNGKAFHFVAIESEPPYALMVWSLDEVCIDPAEQWRAHLTRLYSKCKKENIWPGYPEAAVAVVPPDWAEKVEDVRT